MKTMWRRRRESIPALPLNQDRRARGLAPREEANTTASAAFLLARGVKRERLEATANGARQEGRLIPLRVLESESRSRRGGEVGREGKTKGGRCRERPGAREARGRHGIVARRRRGVFERPIDGTWSETK